MAFQVSIIITCMKLSDVCMYLMHIPVQYIIQLWLKYYAFNSTYIGGATHSKGAVFLR